MCDQNTTRAAAYAEIYGMGYEPMDGKRASRRTFLKASGGLIAGAAAKVSSVVAAAQGAVAADNGTRDIVKRDPQASSLVSSIAEFVHGTGFGAPRPRKPAGGVRSVSLSMPISTSGLTAHIKRRGWRHRPTLAILRSSRCGVRSCAHSARWRHRFRRRHGGASAS